MKFTTYLQKLIDTLSSYKGKEETIYATNSESSTPLNNFEGLHNNLIIAVKAVDEKHAKLLITAQYTMFDKMLVQDTIQEGIFKVVENMQIHPMDNVLKTQLYIDGKLTDVEADIDEVYVFDNKKALRFLKILLENLKKCEKLNKRK